MRQKPLSAFFELRSVLAVLFGFAGLALAFLALPAAQAQRTSRGGSSKDAAPQPEALYRDTVRVVQFDVSPPLRDIMPTPEKYSMLRPNEDRNIVPPIARFSFELDPVVQTTVGDAPTSIPPPDVSFDSVNNISGVSPPDPVGAIGPNHYVVMSNVSFQIHTRTGTVVYGPAGNNTLWAGFGGPCQTQNAGDPIVLYDRHADRWLLTQFTATGPQYFNCVAISTSPDPTGTYYRYAISSGTNFPDYPKYGIWRDAYYISTREFAGNTFAGVGAYALNRAQMLAGNPAAQVISFVVPPGSTPYNIGDGLLPADMDGPNLPPVGSPNYFLGSMDNNGPYGAPQDALTLWKFTANFAAPTASTFVLANTVPVAPFNSMLGTCGGTRSCIPQPSTTNRVDHLGYRQRPMHRLAYRNFGTHESLVTNQSVSGGTGPSGEVSGIRWWEMRSPNSTPVIYQQGTYAPGVTDGVHRWMGSMAMDGEGNIGLGYSSASASRFPSIQYTGRNANSPLGTMPLGEGTIVTGTGSQTAGGSRWGDYTALTVDPVDDKTFWFVNQYFPTTSTAGWRLRVGSFKLSSVPTNILSASSSAIANAGANGVLDPGETVTVSLGVQNVGGPGTPCTSAGMTGTVSASGGVTNVQGSQNYGSMCAGSGITYRDFTFTVSPSVACGGTVTVSMNLSDGNESFGPMTYTFPVGSTATSDVQNFDSVTAPALPAGWVGTASGNGGPGITTTSFPDTAPNAVFLREQTSVGISEVTSAPLQIPGPGMSMSFRNQFNTEANFDGMVLEISINGGAFQDIIAAGGTFTSGGYNSSLPTAWSNPLPNRQAWSGVSAGTAAAPQYITSVVSLPPAAAGQSVRFKWRLGSDESAAPATNPGARIDTVRLNSFACGGTAPTVLSAVSRKTHATLGVFDVPLPLGSLSGNIAIEPRVGTPSGQHQIVITFNSPVTVGSTSVTAGASSSTTAVAGNQVTVTLSGVENAARLAVSLANVSGGGNLGSVTVPVGFLLGDTNNNRAVTGSDVSQTKAAAAAGAVNASTFRSDVNVNGAINASDVGLVKSQSGSVLP